MIVQRNFMIRRRENNRAGDEVFSWRGRKFFLGWRPFRNRDIAGRLNEFLELLVRDRGSIHPESVHAHTVNRARVI